MSDICLDSASLSKLTGVAQDRIREHVKTGRLRCYKVDNRLAIIPFDAVEWILTLAQRGRDANRQTRLYSAVDAIFARFTGTKDSGPQV